MTDEAGAPEFREGRRTTRVLKLTRPDGQGTELRYGFEARPFLCRNGCEHHNHLVCAFCGCYTPVTDDELIAFQDGLARRHGFRPQECRFQITGVCARCQ